MRSGNTPSRYWPIAIIVLILFATPFIISKCSANRRDEIASADWTAALQARTRTRYTALPSLPDDHLPIPPLVALAPDGLRIVLTPSFRDSAQAIALWQAMPGASATGILLILRDSPGDVARTPIVRRRFRMSAAGYGRLMRRLDRILADYPGDDGLCLDGTHVRIERATNARFAAVESNCPRLSHDIDRIVATLSRTLSVQQPMKEPDAPHRGSLR